MKHRQLDKILKKWKTYKNPKWDIQQLYKSKFKKSYGLKILPELFEARDVWNTIQAQFPGQDPILAIQKMKQDITRMKNERNILKQKLA